MPPLSVSWLVPTERHVRFDESKVLMCTKGDEHVEGVPPPDCFIIGILSIGPMQGIIGYFGISFPLMQ